MKEPLTFTPDGGKE